MEKDEDKMEKRAVKVEKVVETRVGVVPVRTRKTGGGSAELNSAWCRSAASKTTGAVQKWQGSVRLLEVLSRGLI